MNIVDEKIIQKILFDYKTNQNSKITNSKCTSYNAQPDIGKHFSSQVFKFVIEYQEDDTGRKKFVFLKIPFVKSPNYQIFLMYDLFRKEFVTYTEVLPHIYAIDQQHFTPQIYYADDILSLYLEDLSQSAYRIANPIERLDFHHCTNALQCLAKLHAFSIKVNEIHGIPQIFKKCAWFDYENRDQGLSTIMSEGFAKFYDYLRPDIQRQYSKQIDLFKRISWSKIVDDIKYQTDAFNVLNHGDFWTANIMFKYDNYAIIDKTKMIDFQQSRWTSPAVDLIYFFITSADFEIFVQYFDLLSRIYSDTLNKILTTLNCSPYRHEDLKGDIQKRGGYAIYVLTCLLPFMNSESTNDQNLSTTYLTAFQNETYMKNATKWFLYFAQNTDTFQFEGKRD